MNWQFNGIPLHPLFVHLVVVFIPLAALAVIAHAAWPAARRKLGWFTPALGVAGFGSTVLAKEAGEWLERHSDHTALLDAHVRIGGQLLPWAGLLLVLAVTEWGWYRLVLPRRAVSGRVQRIVTGAFVLLAVGLAIGATVWLYLIGDSGARSVWLG